MSPRPINPFLAGDPVAGEHFTDRAQEARELVELVLAGQNVMLSAPRRYGKTSLALRTIGSLRATGMLVAYVDLYRAVEKAQLVTRLVNAFHEQLASGPRRVAHDAQRIIAGLVRHLSMTVAGAGGVTWSFQPPIVESERETDLALERALGLPAALAQSRGMRAAVFFDEFQQVVDIDADLPAMMRSVFQEHADVAYVFMGSRQHLMQQVFTERNQPMYRLGRQMTLERIPKGEFAGFVVERFSSTGVAIEPAAVDAILEASGCHPQATQELAQETWSLAEHGGVAASPEVVAEALRRVVNAEKSRYATQWDSLSSNQRRVLRAVALGGGDDVYGERFITTWNLGVAARVQAALRALIERGLVEQVDRGRFRVSDPYMPLWIANGEQPRTFSTG